MRICDELFGDTHHTDNSANAFRHALWNILIAKSVLRILKSEERAISWAGKITSLHEELMPNDPLEKEMDLHNNEVGRICFPEIQTSSDEKIIQYLTNKAEDAVQIKSVEETENFKGILVYIEE